MTCICNEFDTEAESRVIEPDLPSKFTFTKNPTYVTAAILKWVKRQ